MKNWNEYGFAKDGLPNKISTLLTNLEDCGKFYFPNLRETRKLYIFSDFSESQNFYSYTFLMIDEESFEYFSLIQQEFWKNHNLHNRIIEYKKLNDKIRARALPLFLELCDGLNGVLMTFIINKNIKTIYRDEIPQKLEEQMNAWGTKKAREKVLRFREFILLIVRGLAVSDQNVLWVTDNDDFVANNSQIETAKNIIADILLKHLGFNLSAFNLITLDDDNIDKTYEKLSSIADLVAGAVVDYIEDYYKREMIPSIEASKPSIPHKKVKVYPILNWFLRENKSLKKNTILINSDIPETFVLSGLRFP